LQYILFLKAILNVVSGGYSTSVIGGIKFPIFVSFKIYGFQSFNNTKEKIAILILTNLKFVRNPTAILYYYPNLGLSNQFHFSLNIINPNTTVQITMFAPSHAYPNPTSPYFRSAMYPNIITINDSAKFR